MSRMYAKVIRDDAEEKMGCSLEGRLVEVIGDVKADSLIIMLCNGFAPYAVDVKEDCYLVVAPYSRVMDVDQKTGERKLAEVIMVAQDSNGELLIGNDIIKAEDLELVE